MADTYPQISIYTLNPGDNACSMIFDYLPESVSFSVTANYDDTPLPMTAIRILVYKHTVIDDVNLTFTVVAGCSSAITYLAKNEGGKGTAAVTSTRNSLIKIAKYLSSLALPLQNLGSGQGSKPPPSCRLTVGPFFSCVGGFTNISIKYEGPYDFDGSPTNMEVTVGFKASQMYDSNSNAGGVNTADLTTQAVGADGSPTMAGATELLDDTSHPYVVWVSPTAAIPPNIDSTSYNPTGANTAQNAVNSLHGSAGNTGTAPDLSKPSMFAPATPPANAPATPTSMFSPVTPANSAPSVPSMFSPATPPAPAPASPPAVTIGSGGSFSGPGAALYKAVQASIANQINSEKRSQNGATPDPVTIANTKTAAAALTAWLAANPKDPISIYLAANPINNPAVP